MSQIPFDVSFEFRSPERDSSVEDYMLKLSPLMAFHPVFASIANHQPEGKYVVDNDWNLVKNVKDKHPSTYYFAIALKDQFDIEVVPHLLCNELDPINIDDILIGFKYVGIKKVMALRGDRRFKDRRYKNRYSHADEMVKHVSGFNKKNGANFGIGIAGYPDVHLDAVSEAGDLLHLKNKVDLGADFVTTQMFLDNQSFFVYLDRCRERNIISPIIPG